MTFKQKRILIMVFLTVTVIFTVAVSCFFAILGKFKNEINIANSLDKSGVDSKCINKVINDICAENVDKQDGSFFDTNIFVADKLNKTSLMRYFNLAKCITNNIDKGTAEEVADEYYSAPKISPLKAISLAWKYRDIDLSKLDNKDDNSDISKKIFEMLGKLSKQEVKALIGAFYDIVEYIDKDTLAFNDAIDTADKILRLGVLNDELAIKDSLVFVNYFGGAVAEIKDIERTMTAIQVLLPQAPKFILEAPNVIKAFAEIAKELTLDEVTYLIADAPLGGGAVPKNAFTIVNFSKFLMRKPIFAERISIISIELDYVFKRYGQAEMEVGTYVVNNIKYFATKDKKTMSEEDKQLAENFYATLKQIYVDNLAKSQN